MAKPTKRTPAEIVEMKTLVKQAFKVIEATEWQPMTATVECTFKLVRDIDDVVQVRLPGEPEVAVDRVLGSRELRITLTEGVLEFLPTLASATAHAVSVVTGNEDICATDADAPTYQDGDAMEMLGKTVIDLTVSSKRHHRTPDQIGALLLKFVEQHLSPELRRAVPRLSGRAATEHLKGPRG